jgi:hypothetical protein
LERRRIADRRLAAPLRFQEIDIAGAEAAE